MPTTVGATRASRAAASSTKRPARRRSTGAVTSAGQVDQERDGQGGRHGQRRRPARPSRSRPPPRPPRARPRRAARVRSRRVQASGEVRPRSERPSGSGGHHGGGHHPGQRPPSVATAGRHRHQGRRAALAGVTVHHRAAKRRDRAGQVVLPLGHPQPAEAGRHAGQRRRRPPSPRPAPGAGSPRRQGDGPGPITPVRPAVGRPGPRHPGGRPGPRSGPGGRPRAAPGRVGDGKTGRARSATSTGTSVSSLAPHQVDRAGRWRPCRRRTARPQASRRRPASPPGPPGSRANRTADAGPPCAPRPPGPSGGGAAPAGSAAAGVPPPLAVEEGHAGQHQPLDPVGRPGGPGGRPPGHRRSGPTTVTRSARRRSPSNSGSRCSAYSGRAPGLGGRRRGPEAGQVEGDRRRGPPAPAGPPKAAVEVEVGALPAVEGQHRWPGPAPQAAPNRRPPANDFSTGTPYR